MANDLRFEPTFIKQPFPLEKHVGKQMAVDNNKGEVLFDKVSGEQYRVTKTSNVNGVDHIKLVSEATHKTVYLSKFAVDERFSSQKDDVESFGRRMIVRLSKMF
jgi:hypothetical protein